MVNFIVIFCRVDEEMIESLFGVSAAERNKQERKKELAAFEQPNQYIQIIDPKKAQNLAILLRALNVTTEEVCDAIKEGELLSLALSLTHVYTHIGVYGGI